MMSWRMYVRVPKKPKNTKTNELHVNRFHTAMSTVIWNDDFLSIEIQSSYYSKQFVKTFEVKDF